MKIIKDKLFYWHGNNFGDELNKIIFEKIFNVKFNYSDVIYEAKYIAIGSILDHLIIKETFFNKFIFPVYYALNHHNLKLIVLGSGFKYDKASINLARKLDVKILRGKLSYKILEKNNLVNGNVIFGDLGILSSNLITEIPQKKYKIGIIPHLNDLNSNFFFDFYKSNIQDSIFINVKDKPLDIINQIASCEKIVSSSLHGLIVADSFSIPNLWIENRFKHQECEPRFKFLDYYSTFDIDNIEPMNIINLQKLSIYDKSNFKIIDKNKVDRNKLELMNYLIDFFKN